LPAVMSVSIATHYCLRTAYCINTATTLLADGAIFTVDKFKCKVQHSPLSQYRKCEDF